MSLRSDIIGWVIRRLAEIDAADQAQRTALFHALKTEIETNGFGAASAAESLIHFEAAVAMQDIVWLRASPPPASAAPAPTQEPASKPPAAAKPWKWPKRLTLPARPPGPQPGEPSGPYADHVYETVTLTVPGGTCALRLSWAYDPACILTADSPEIGFRFKTRAASFALAVDHLAEVLALAKLELPAAVRQFDL